MYFKLGRLTEITKIYMLIEVWVVWTFIQGHIAWEIKNFKSIFLQI